MGYWNLWKYVTQKKGYWLCMGWREGQKVCLTRFGSGRIMIENKTNGGVGHRNVNIELSRETC